jgi:hypothetical protein
MKNLFILTVFALIALTSCKKDYTCECKYYEDGYLYNTGTTTIKDTKSKAKTSCDNLDASSNLGGYLIESKCEIK